MINQYWVRMRDKIDDLSLRERALIFAATAFILVSLVNALLLDPPLAQQKILSGQIVQQQEKMKEIQAQLEALMQAKRSDENSPIRQHLQHIKQELSESGIYIKGLHDRLVPAEKIPDLLEQVLKRGGSLQLVNLKTLPLTPLMEKDADKKDTGGAYAAPAAAAEGGRQIFKHGVQITVRGSYLDMLNYLVALEHFPSQMLWGMAQMKVVQYPVAELTLTVYTLSLDKTWLLI